LKIIGLALTLALLLGATSAGSASAATSLCKAVQNPCMAANKWASGTEYTVELKAMTEAVMVAVGTANELKCTESKTMAKTNALEGAPLLGEITAFTFNNCAPCTVVTVLHLNFKAELEFTAAGNGNMTLRTGGAGNPAVKFANCPAGVSCIYKAEAVAAKVTGGQPAVVHFENAGFEKEVGPVLVCGNSGTFTAEYDIVQAKEPGQMAVNNPRVMVEQ
jgi:hypothetical protein